MFKATVEFVALFWNKLAAVRTELGKSDIARRKRVRESLLVDSALAISSYVASARKMYVLRVDGSRLEKLGHPVTITVKAPAGEEQWEIDLFFRENPIWEQIGILVLSTKKSG